jgi:hypothetical protein
MKMKKYVVLLFVLLLTVLAGCEETKINYEGKLLPVSEVEEIIADKLEVDNPDLDLEVDIYEEIED